MGYDESITLVQKQPKRCYGGSLWIYYFVNLWRWSANNIAFNQVWVVVLTLDRLIGALLISTMSVKLIQPWKITRIQRVRHSIRQKLEQKDLKIRVIIKEGATQHLYSPVY